MPMTGDGPQIVIKGRREDWPGGARTLTPRAPGREPNRQTFWFGAELDPDGSQVWFRITSEAVRRMREGDAVARGERLVDALLAWLTPSRRLGPEVSPDKPPHLRGRCAFPTARSGSQQIPGYPTQDLAATPARST